MLLNVHFSKTFHVVTANFRPASTCFFEKCIFPIYSFISHILYTCIYMHLSMYCFHLFLFVLCIPPFLRYFSCSYYLFLFPILYICFSSSDCKRYQENITYTPKQSPKIPSCAQKVLSGSYRLHNISEY